jgi:hypothetical protein
MTNKFIKNDFKMSKSDLFAADTEFGGCCIQKKPARFSFTRLGILITVIVLSLFAKNHSVAARPLLGNHIAPIRQNACRC